MAEVTIVIPNLNGEKFIENCLNSIYEKTTIDIDILVVDNGSKDKSVEIIKSGFPDVRVIALSKNYGFCKAVNVGIQNSETPFVLLLNNDVEVADGFVESLLNRILSKQSIFSVEALMLQYNRRDCVDSAGTFYNALGWAFARGKDKPPDRYMSNTEVFAACAGAAIYRRAVFDIIGYFDEAHFAYLEDVDIGYRAAIHGYRNIYEPKAKVFHVGSGTSGSRHNEFKVRLSARNSVYLIYKNMPVIQFIINSPLLLSGILVKWLFFARKGLGKAYVKGIMEGKKGVPALKKVRYSSANLSNYIRIQLDLWINIIRRFL